MNSPESNDLTTGMGALQRISLPFKRLTDWLFSAPASVREIGARRQAQLLAILSFLFFITSGIGAVTSFMRSGVVNLVFVGITIVPLIVYVFSRTSRFIIGSWILSWSVWLAAYLQMLNSDNPSAAVLSFVSLAFVLSGFLLPVPVTLAMTVASLIAPLLLVGRAAFDFDMGGVIGVPITIGILVSVTAGVRGLIERQRLAELQTTNRELEAMRVNLEAHVEERTHAFEISAEVSRRLSTFLDPQQLVAEVVKDVKQAFGYYHAQIYLLDKLNNDLVLAGGTGEAGKTLMERGHKLASGRGLVGRAAQNRTSVLVQDTIGNPAWLPNALLPETKSEIAVPITVGDEVLGVLDVQQNVVDGLNEQDVKLLQAIASQVAIALQNANQYTRTQSALSQVQEQEGRFRAIFQGSNDAIMLLDQNGFFDCNDRTLELFGFLSQDQFVKVSPADVSPPFQPDGRDSTSAAQERIQTAYQRGALRFDWVHRRTTGEDFPAEVILSAFDMGGRRVLQATVRDFSERERAQAALAKQAADLIKVAEIGTTVATLLHPDELLQRVVDLTRDGFGLYHSHIYLLNENSDYLELACGAGEVGQQMVKQGWRIPLNRERSLVARAARERLGVIVNDVRAEPDFLSNPLLPDTAAEMAVPLIAGEHLFGVLDVQSDRVGYFTSADVAIQMTLAAQVAVALQNARRYQQTVESELLTRTIIDATPDWIFIKDREHRYRIVNRRYARALKMAPEMMIGKDDLELGLSEEVVKGNPAKGIRGYWVDDDEVFAKGETIVVPSERSIQDGKQRWVNTIKVPLRDEEGHVWGVLGFVRDITDREILRQETEERLEEIASLNRVMTREAWQQFQKAIGQELSYFYDQTSVVAAGNQWQETVQLAMQQNSVVQTSTGTSLAALPLSLRGDVIGALAIQIDPQNPLSPEELSLAQEMSDQIVLALESARLFTQTQLALGQTETLYSIIAEMNAAGSYQEILGALSRQTYLQNADQLLMMGIFDIPLDNDHLPEWIYPAAYQTSSAIEVATRYPVSAFQVKPNTLFTNQPVVIADIASDQRLDRVTRTLFQEVFQAKSSMVIPLMLGSQAIGFVQGYFGAEIELPDAELQLLSAVSGQAAIAVQSRILLDQAQSRARQEARIREITAQVFNATDVDTIMRRAVEQIGRVLKTPAFIFLKDFANDSLTEADQAEK